MKSTFFVIVGLVLLASCSKEEVLPVVGSTQDSTESSFEKDIARRYLEFACTAQYDDGRWFAGTLCKEGQGNCKKKRVCTPVSTNALLNQDDLWVIAEEHVSHGVSEGYFDAEGYDALLQVAHEAAVMQFEIDNQ